MSKKMLVISDSRKANRGEAYVCFPLDGGNKGAQIGRSFEGDERISIPMFWLSAKEAEEQILRNAWASSFLPGENWEKAVKEILHSRHDRHGGLAESPDEFPGLKEHYPEVYQAFFE